MVNSWQFCIIALICAVCVDRLLLLLLWIWFILLTFQRCFVGANCISDWRSNIESCHLGLPYHSRADTTGAYGAIPRFETFQRNRQGIKTRWKELPFCIFWFDSTWFPGDRWTTDGSALRLFEIFQLTLGGSKTFSIAGKNRRRLFKKFSDLLIKTFIDK